MLQLQLQILLKLENHPTSVSLYVTYNFLVTAKMIDTHLKNYEKLNAPPQ